MADTHDVAVAFHSKSFIHNGLSHFGTIWGRMPAFLE